jgi:hypothetical protein
MMGLVKFLLLFLFISGSFGVDEWVLRAEHADISIVVRDFIFLLEYRILKSEFNQPLD